MRGGLARVLPAVVLVAVAGSLSPATAPRSATTTEGRASARPTAKVNSDLTGLPLYFIENKGQADPQVDYYLQGSQASVYFTPGGVTLALSSPSKASQDPSSMRPEAVRKTPKRWAVRQQFLGADPSVQPEGRAPTPAVISYFKGSPDQWKTGIPTHSSITYKDLWPGIDLTYDGTGGSLKYTFLVHPGADPSNIQMAYQGARSVRLNASGQLQVSTPLGGFNDDRPVAWQDTEGRRSMVMAAYDLGRGGAYGFRLGSYDRTRPLVLDPAVQVYSGFIGGSGGDSGSGVAVDSAGAAYVTGSTDSTGADFPATVGPDLSSNGASDAFVAKVKPDGTGLVYAGFIGGTSQDYGYAIGVDGAGAAYVTGTTTSQAGFPAVAGPDATFNGSEDAFVAKINPDGTGLTYAGYIGGSGYEEGRGIAVDGAGAAYVAGYTGSGPATFPATGGPSLLFNGIVDGAYDAFVAKVKVDGTGMTYAGYIGGSGWDFGFDIAVDAGGAAYITGETGSSETTFPVAVGPDRTSNGRGDAFVAKVKADGTGLTYAGYIGSPGVDRAWGIALDSTGAAYVTGHTNASYSNGGYDVFVAKVKSDGTELSTYGYFGGSGDDAGSGIAVDSAGAAYLIGTTSSTNFPSYNGPDATYNGTHDAFVAKLNTSGNDFVYVGYMGGSAFDTGSGIAVDSAGAAYVTGRTLSSQATFPTRAGPDLTHNSGSGFEDDAFVAKVAVRTQHTLTVTKNGTGSGTFHSTPAGISCEVTCSAQFDEGTVVTLTHTADTGSVFTGWSGACSGTGSCQVTMTGAKSVTATFDKVKHALTVTKNGTGSGKVQSSPAGIDCGSTCSAQYNEGSVVTLTPTPDSGSVFTGWSGACSGTGSCQVTMTGAKSVTATFGPLVVVNNLLKNPGFELDSNGDNRPDKWSSNARFTRRNAVVHSGNFAGRHWAPDNSSYTVYQGVTHLRAGTTYAFEGYVNIPATTDKFTFRLQVQWRNSSKKTISTKTVKTYTAQTAGWHHFTASLVAPRGARSALVRMVVSSLKATIHVDDLAFAP